MAKENLKQTANGSAPDFAAQIWAAAELAVTAPVYAAVKFQGARPEGLSGGSVPQSEWCVKDASQRSEAAGNRSFSFSASNEIPRSRERERMSAGKVRVVRETQFNAERVGVRCGNSRMSRRGIHNIRRGVRPCASTPAGVFVSSEKFVEKHSGRVTTSRFTDWDGRKSIQRLAMNESRMLNALLPKLRSGGLPVSAKPKKETRS